MRAYAHATPLARAARARSSRRRFVGAALRSAPEGGWQASSNAVGSKGMACESLYRDKAPATDSDPDPATAASAARISGAAMTNVGGLDGGDLGERDRTRLASIVGVTGRSATQQPPSAASCIDPPLTC